MSMRPVLAAVAALLVLNACASGGSPEPSSKAVVVDEGSVRSSVTPGSRQSFAAPAAKMWNALGAAYAGLGLTVDINDASGGRIGVSNFYFTGQVNGHSMSYYASCGSGMTGPIADTRRVYFSMATTMTPVDAAHTALVTEVDPTAVDVAGGASDRISCGSTGALEALLYAGVARQLGTP